MPPTTTLNDAREAVYLRWETEWASTTPYVFGAEQSPGVSSGSWARLRFNNEHGQQETLGVEGSRRFNRRGRILIWIYTEPGGLRAGDILANQALGIFESKRFSGVWTYGGTIKSEIGNRWIEHLIDVPCEYEESK